MCIRFIKRGGTDTSDATATAGDLINPKTAYVDGQKITGTLVENGTYQKTVTDIYDSSQESRVYYRRNNLNPGVAIKTGNSIRLYSSYSTLANAIALTPEKIKKDVTIIGVTGTYEGGGGTSFVVPNGMKFAYSSFIPTTLDTSEVTDMDNMFSYLAGIVSLPQIDTSNVVTAQAMFSHSTSLTSLPEIDTSKITNAQSFCANNTSLTSLPEIDTSKITNALYFCYGCTSLVNVPELNFSSIVETAMTATYCKDMFGNCSSLSNESLNNILAMCITMSPHSSHKNLKRIGLSSAQATTCQGLSNYQAFLNAGWTTGY